MLDGMRWLGLDWDEGPHRQSERSQRHAEVIEIDEQDRNPLAAGRPFFISQGEPTSLWELIDLILAAAGRPPVARAVPTPVAWTAGAVLEAVHKTFRLPGEPRMTRFVAREGQAAVDLAAGDEQRADSRQRNACCSLSVARRA